jgi:cytochrome c oxidase subunit 1
MTPEKLTLRYLIVAVLFLAVAGIEGMLMRTELMNVQIMEPEHYYAMLTAHPIVGIYGFAYLAVFGAFFYLFPKVLNRPLYSLRLANLTMWIIVAGVLLAWSAGFFLGFGALYTLYWPLPVERFSPLGVTAFAVGLALVEVGVLAFIFNIFATVLKRNPSDGLTNRRAIGKLLAASLNLDLMAKGLSGLMCRAVPSGHAPISRSMKDEENGGQPKLPVFAVAVMRGGVDAVINAVVLAGAGVLMLVFSLPPLIAGVSLNPSAVDPLVYKNVFWWGLDMIADGDVLIWVAGTLYLLAPLLAGRKLYAENVVRYVILADLIVSMGVWSHHLLSDMPQPSALRLFSGQFVTWGEFFTMGLSFFTALMTLWLARPLKMSMPLKFMLGGIFGFMLGGFSGLLQANYGLNVIMHNTQWVPGFHVHEMLLVGLGNIIFAVAYALLPMLTGKALASERLSNLHFWLWTVGGVGMAFSMGLAWTPGMLRRMLYPGVDAYLPYMSGAAAFGVVLALGFLAFLVNLVRTYGLGTLVGLFFPLDRLGASPRGGPSGTGARLRATSS